MDYGVYRYDEPYGYRQPRRRVNYFGWTVAILLLTGFALAAWLLSFYIFGQPERPESYRVLQKLHKIDPPKRFELTAAPKGEFLDAKALVDRYSSMGSAELAKTNAELARNYIRNYQQVRGLVPYVVGRFVIMEARELGPNDIFTSGMVALTNAVDQGELLMEHVYPADAQAVPLMANTLTRGLEIRLERTHDLSAVIHAERLRDGRIMLTAIPLLYGTYTVTKGTGTFTLEPPFELNLEPGWPLYKEQPRLRAELHFAQARREASPENVAPPPVSGLAISPNATPPPAANALVHVEQARPVEPVATPKGSKLAKATPAPAKSKLAKNEKPSPAPSAAPSESPPSALAQQSPAAAAAPSPAEAPVVAPAIALASPEASVSPNEAANALASTAGGGTWKTFPAGKMPLGRLIASNELKDLVDHGGVAGERIYLKGQFIVNASDANHAVLRPRTRLASAMLHLGGSNTRIVVEFPAGYTPPAQGSVVTRDDARPLEITEVRKEEDGQINVFAREIMQ